MSFIVSRPDSSAAAAVGAAAGDARLQEERELLAQAVHELRSPLAILQGVHYLLARDHDANAKASGRPVDPRSRRHLALLQEAIQSLTTQVDQLLDLPSVATGGCPVKPMALATVIATAAERLNGAHEPDAQPQVRWSIAPDIRADLAVDGARLAIALRNLIGNALKYSPPGAPVDVTASLVRQGEVRIEVRDQGRGVPPADRERLGEAYFRASNTAGTPGTGLGLRVVRRAIEAMGGRFGYEPPPDGAPGAIFWLECPPLDQPATGGDPQPAPEPPARRRRRSGGANARSAARQPGPSA